MKNNRYVALALMGALLFLSACKQESVSEAYHPATVEETEREGIKRVRLDQRATERIGLQTAVVTEERIGNATRKVVPYGAVMYDTHGNAWTYTNPEPLAFVREPIVVERIDGDRAILTDGPSVGTTIVTVGATELMGAEHNYGGH